jgi:hypothetical protein
MPYSDEQIKQMTPEQREQAAQSLEQELLRRKSAGGQRAVGGVVGGITGALRGLSGQSPATPPSVNPLEKMVLASQLKGTQPTKYEPTTMAETLELERARAGVKSEAESLKPRSAMEIRTEKSMKEADEKKAFASQEIKDSALDMLDAIKEAKAGRENFGIKGIIPPVPNTPQAKWHANVDKLLAANVITIMNNMKQASRTGATGFGQLNRSELKLLQDAATTLKKTLDPRDAIAILDKMEAKFRKVAGEPEGGIDSGLNAEIGKVITAPNGKQYRIIGGDPSDPDVEEI